jgi:hypothetical protein
MRIKNTLILTLGSTVLDLRTFDFEDSIMIGGVMTGYDNEDPGWRGLSLKDEPPQGTIHEQSDDAFVELQQLGRGCLVVNGRGNEFDLRRSQLDELIRPLLVSADDSTFNTLAKGFAEYLIAVGCKAGDLNVLRRDLERVIRLHSPSEDGQLK